MRSPFLLRILLLISGSLAKYTIVCDNTQAPKRIENAIDEAIEMAKSTRRTKSTFFEVTHLTLRRRKKQIS